MPGLIEKLRKKQLKNTVRKRLKDGCSHLVTAYLRDVEGWQKGKPFCAPRDFEWTVRRVVPVAHDDKAPRWEDIMPGANETDDPNNQTGESTVRKATTKLARFIGLNLP